MICQNLGEGAYLGTYSLQCFLHIQAGHFNYYTNHQNSINRNSAIHLLVVFEVPNLSLSSKLPQNVKLLSNSDLQRHLRLCNIIIVLDSTTKCLC